MIRYEIECILCLFQPEAMCHQGTDPYFTFGDQIDSFLRAMGLSSNIQYRNFSSPQFMHRQGNIVRCGNSDDNELAAGFQQSYSLNYCGRVSAALINNIHQ